MLVHDKRTYQARLERHFVAAESALHTGGVWYSNSRRVARRLARENGVTLSVAAGVIAALSPRVQWAVNVRMAEALLSKGETAGLGNSLEAARRIIDGEKPTSVLKGPKTNAFYRAIMGDEDSVVLDSWMLYAAGWHKDGCTPKEYTTLAECLRRAAERHSVSPREFQAIVWTHVRGRAA
jgi:hypothetical protein